MPPSNPLSRSAARDYYDRYGLRQDDQHYEDAAVEQLLAHLQLSDATRVVEFGCGTGRWGQVMLEHHLSQMATYWGCDISSTMVATAQERLQRFGARVQVVQIEGDLPLPLGAQGCDRILSTYVLDLLPDAEIEQFIAEAHRLLQPGGWLGLASITPGPTLSSAVVMQGWQWLHLLKPEVLGGCRPIRLAPRLSQTDWAIELQTVTTASGIASEVLAARKR